MPLMWTISQMRGCQGFVFPAGHPGLLWESRLSSVSEGWKRHGFRNKHSLMFHMFVFSWGWSATIKAFQLVCHQLWFVITLHANSHLKKWSFVVIDLLKSTERYPHYRNQGDAPAHPVSPHWVLVLLILDRSVLNEDGDQYALCREKEGQSYAL